MAAGCGSRPGGDPLGQLASGDILPWVPDLASSKGCNRDLPGRRLAALQEAMLQHHADGNRQALGDTLRVAAGMLARLGEAGPAAVLSGALAGGFPGAFAAFPERQRGAIDRAQALARDTLGQAAYDAAMDENEIVRYAVGEFQRVAALLAEPGGPAPHAPVLR